MKLYVKRATVMTVLILAAMLRMPSAAAAAVPPDAVIPLGIVSGIEIETKGVAVCDYTKTTSPAAQAGILPGDMITAVAGREINSAHDLRFACAGFDGDAVTVRVCRGDEQMNYTVTPQKNESGKWELGVIVRDSLNGIGTLTFFDPVTGIFGALGHGVNDAQTGASVPLRAGSITRSVITGVVRGLVGAPGRIMGMTDNGKARGSVDVNTPFGIFGIAEDSTLMEGELLPVAAPSEIQEGDAWLLSNIAGEGVKRYAVRIVRVYGNTPDGRNMSIKVTDEELIDITGGIVQGMSGSPLVQNGKIIGAVTHVLVHDPAKGYGIFIENMFKAADMNGKDAA